MSDKVYPASKPILPPAMNASGNGNSTAPPAAPTTKSQLYNPTRPRPQQPTHSRRRRRSCRRFCCLCFIYTLIFILSALLLAAIAACVFYVLYHPKHPTFSITSVKISSFNLSTPSDAGAFSHLNSKLDFTLTAKNPNQKIAFFYDQFSVAVASSAGTNAGNATLPAFAHSPGNTTILKATVASDSNQDIDPDSATKLKADLAKKSGFPLTVKVDTKVEVKMGKMKTKKVGIRVSCDGIRGFEPKRNATSKKTTPALASVSGAKCKVYLRIKIWRFTF